MGQFLPADHSKGDANTIGGYTAVHARPAAFEGQDGASYSVEIVSDETGEASRPYAAYLLFVRWREGDPVASGHLETNYLEYANSEQEAITKVGTLKLSDVRALLYDLIAERAESELRAADSEKRWWDAMREESEGDA